MCDNREGREKPQFHSFFQQSQKGVVIFFFFFKKMLRGAGKGDVLGLNFRICTTIL